MRLVWLTAAAIVTLAAGVICGNPGEARAKSHILRQGDVVRVRLNSSVDASLAAGDTVGVTIPDAWQRDPKGAPEIPAGTRGVLVLQPGEKKDQEVHFDVSQMIFYPEGKRVVAGARLSPDTPGLIQVKSASFIKKLLVPPLLGFLFWHGHSSMDAGTPLNVEIQKRVDWTNP